MIKIDWQMEAQTDIPDSGIQNNVTAQKDLNIYVKIDTACQLDWTNQA